MRVRILARLEKGETSVQDLADRLATTPQNVSRHLGLLHRSGIVERRREGTRVYYALADYSACLIVSQAVASLIEQTETLSEALADPPGLEPAASPQHVLSATK